jgi:hypothetical protein
MAEWKLRKKFSNFGVTVRYDVQGTGSPLVLVPDQNMGLFVSYNAGDTRLPLQEATLASFVDAFFPPKTLVSDPTSALNDAQRVAGTYRRTRASFSKMEKVT